MRGLFFNAALQARGEEKFGSRALVGEMPGSPEYRLTVKRMQQIAEGKIPVSTQLKMAGNRFTSAPGHRWAMRQTKAMFGIGKGLGVFGRVLGVGFVGYAGYQGYKQGGWKGAAKNIARTGIETYLVNRALFTLGRLSYAAIPIGIGAAVGYTMNAVQQAGAEKLRKHATLEMGAPVEDPFGNIATGRQRAMMAMQRSHINGRSAAGNEAALMYRPYFR